MAEESWQERAKGYGQVVARAWRDGAFKRRLLGDPHAALGEHGIAVPEGHEVRVVEDTAQVTHLVLPRRPDDLTDEQLDQIVGGSSGGAGGYAQTNVPWTSL